MDKKTETIETYNKSTKALADKFNKSGARIDDIERVFAHFEKNDLNVLEIGCGNGRDAQEILKHTKNYLGIDVSEEMIKLAKESLPEAKFVVADIEDYVLPVNLDIIFAFASLLHTDKDSLRQILDSAYRALNPGGIFFISLKYGGYHEKTTTDKFGTRTYYFYTPEKIFELMDKKYKVIYENIYSLRDQEWFTIILQK